MLRDIDEASTAIRTVPVVGQTARITDAAKITKRQRRSDGNLSAAYAELRREHSEFKDTAHKLECEVAGLRGRIEQLEELNKRLTEERDQFLERYYRLVTQFETLGGGIDRARADVNDTIGVLRRRLEKPETKELPSLPPAKSLNNSNGQLEESIAKITATLGGEHRQAAE